MEFDDLALNEATMGFVEELMDSLEDANVAHHEIGGASVIDCGIDVPGSLRAARIVSEACLAGWGGVGFRMERLGKRPCAKIVVEIDEPAAACLLSQYAGWKVQVGRFFAMTSGPIRAALAEEKVFEKLDYSEEADAVVAIMETRQLPTEKVIEYICKTADVEPESLHILVAPTASLVGGTQVVARTVETAMHKLFELGYDVRQVRAGCGTAFLPPVPRNDLLAIGRTNDAILYGGEVILWVEGEDDDIERLGPQVPSNSSKAFGKPFADLFKEAGGDFYKIDPKLFSPASILLNNLSSGRSFHFGELREDLVEASFFGAG